MALHPVILSGGSGSRLWPMSRSTLPKQLLPLSSERTMLQETILRLQGLISFAAPILVCNNDHRFMVAEQLREIGVEAEVIFLEPVGRNTAPATAVAAWSLLDRDPDALMLVLPADHLVRDVTGFQLAVQTAVRLAAEGAMVTFGIVPEGPETDYGYIHCGEETETEAGCYRVTQFVEKPDLVTARLFVDSGDYYWNSGMFLFKASRYLDELQRINPEIAMATKLAYENGVQDMDFYRLEEESFSACLSNSIDYAVMEQTAVAVVVPVDIGWSDIGSWSDLWDTGVKDTVGNVVRGDVYTDETANCLIRSEGRIVAVIGVEDLVIVETTDAVLVSHKDKVQNVKKVVEHLQRNGRTEHISHTRVFRPWGWYEGIDAGERFQVKRIMVKPGEMLSLQMHHHRAEHWIIVTGTARVTRGDEILLLSENQSTYIPLGETHRLENPGRVPLHMIEVQSGSYLGEDDIVRFKDVYQRS